MRLEEIEKQKEVEEQEAESIGQEVKEHQERLGKLEEQVKELQGAMSDVESDAGGGAGEARHKSTARDVEVGARCLGAGK
jgi:uncharacterized coiled-coil protein SlyX